MSEENEVVIAAVGDVLCLRDEPMTMFRHVRDILRNADVAIGQLETPYSSKGSRGSSGWRGAVPKDVEMYPCVPDAGFDVVSMAGNHVLDWGADALLDCIDRLTRDGIGVVGAGRNLAAARKSHDITVAGTSISFLAYCSVAPNGYYAASDMPGVAPMRAMTLYQPVEEDQPGTPCHIRTFPNSADLAALQEDVRAARQSADIVILSLHWGVHHQRSVIADYQPAVAHAAIDAGADVILGHHPHILKGIEVYRNRVIFYSLGNFAFDRIVGPRWATLNADWMAQRAQTYNLGDSPYRGFHKEGLLSLIAKVYIANGVVARVALVPVVINDNSEPVPYEANSPEGIQLKTYLETIGAEAGLETVLGVDGPEIVVSGRAGDSAIAAAQQFHPTSHR